jgi:hypothetical protein
VELRENSQAQPIGRHCIGRRRQLIAAAAAFNKLPDGATPNVSPDRKQDSDMNEIHRTNQSARASLARF